MLRSRSSTCDSIQSSSSPIANCPSRQFTLPSYTQSAGTSPKQHTNVGQYLGSGNNLGVGSSSSNGGGGGGGGSSPSSACSQNIRGTRNSLNMQSELAHVTGARKSTSTANMNSLKKRAAPAPPPGTLSGAPTSIFYGTLPHPPRHSQNMDANDIRSINHKNQSMDVAYGTLPHMRSVENSPRITGGGGSGAGGGAGGSVGGGGNGSNSSLMPMTTFGHKRSPSGESLNRNIHLAGAKLVLPPTGELPTLKHVDKSALMRPKIPPPGPPAGKWMEPHYYKYNYIYFYLTHNRARDTKWSVQRKHQLNGWRSHCAATQGKFFASCRFSLNPRSARVVDENFRFQCILCISPVIPTNFSANNKTYWD